MPIIIKVDCSYAIDTVSCYIKRLELLEGVYKSLKIVKNN